MSEDGRRPGGLTALAVLNFIFGGFGALGILAIVALFGLAKSTKEGSEAVDKVSSPLLMVLLLFEVVRVALMIVSAIGYLGQKRVMGRYLGSAYALLALASTALSFAIPEVSFNIGTIIGLVYPLLTLVLLNTTFKEDLVR
jgi:hypothetical protein